MGAILVLLALIFVAKQGSLRKWGALISIIIATSGMNLVPVNWFYFKPNDLTLIFALGAWFLTKNETVKFAFDDSGVVKFIKIFITFLLCSAVFSLIYYELGIYDIIQGGRSWFIIILYFFYRKLDFQEIKWLLNVILWLSVINAVLYIPQTLFGWHTLPYDYETFVLGRSNARYYNIPIFIDILSAILVICPQYVKINKKWIIPVLGIFIINMVLSQNRTALFSLLLSLSVGLLLKGELGRIGKYTVIGALCILPFSGLILDRIQSTDNYGNNTESDIANVLSGGFINDYSRGAGGTMTFRFAYAYERAEYLAHRPLGEQIFGFGMVSDSNPWVRNHYQFSVGNYIMDDSGRNDAMGNADIAYGMMIPSLGFLGTIILLSLYVYITRKSFRYRKRELFGLAFFISCISMWITSFAGSNMAYMSSLAISLLWFIIMLGAIDADQSPETV